MMPVWLMILFGAVPGGLALVVAIFHMGAMRRDVHDIMERAKGWDQARLDLAYIKGRLEGADIERLSAAPVTRRSRAALKVAAS